MRRIKYFHRWQCGCQAKEARYKRQHTIGWASLSIQKYLDKVNQQRQIRGTIAYGCEATVSVVKATELYALGG